MASIGLKGFYCQIIFRWWAMGVSLLLEVLTKIDLSYLIIIVNLPFILIGAKQISIQFAIKSILAIVTLAFLVHFVNLPAVTTDKLLIAVLVDSF